MSTTKYNALINVNTVGHSVFHNVISAGLRFIYDDNEAEENHTNAHVLIDNYQCNLSTEEHSIIFILQQTLFTIHLKIINIDICTMLNFDISVKSCGNHVIEINNCTCSDEVAHEKFVFFKIMEHHKFQCTHKENTVQFKNCHFIKIFRQHVLPLTLIQILYYSG